jgi:hypothetical protein
LHVPIMSATDGDGQRILSEHRQGAVGGDGRIIGTKIFLFYTCNLY